MPIASPSLTIKGSDVAGMVKAAVERLLAGRVQTLDAVRLVVHGRKGL